MKASINILMVSSFVSVLSIVSLAAHAIDSGRVVFTVGDPVITDSQGSRGLAKGDEVNSGNTILTQSGIV